MGRVLLLIFWLLLHANPFIGWGNSSTAHLHLNHDGSVTLSSNGTITAIQFELLPPSPDMTLSLLVTTDHVLAFNQQVGRGVIFSLNNTPFEAGDIYLMQVNGVNYEELYWGEVYASNTSNQSVEITTSTFYENYDPPHIHLHENGVVTLNSMGNLIAIQFSIFPINSDIQVSLLLETDHVLAFSNTTGTGLIFSLNNSTIPPDEVILMYIDAPNLDELQWGEVIASNINHQSVSVTATKYVISSSPVIFSNNHSFIYPNPSRGFFTASLNIYEETFVKINVYDVTGKVVHSSAEFVSDSGEKEFLVDCSKLKNGVYVVKIEMHNTNYSKQSLIQKLIITK